MHETNSFLTLTYSPEHLPADGSINVVHWQLFAKRLRKILGPIRYFHCGEYGAQLGRPHYHAILFGHDFKADKKVHDANKGTYTSKLLEETWGKGFCTVGSVTHSSAAYVARYIMKKQNGASAAAHYHRELVDPHTGEITDTQLKPEYVTMSRNPGLGSTWYDKYKSDVFPSDQVIFKGKARIPPSYYFKRLEKEDPKLHEELKERRRNSIDPAHPDSTPDRLRVREKVAEARDSRSIRPLDQQP